MRIVHPFRRLLPNSSAPNGVEAALFQLAGEIPIAELMDASRTSGCRHANSSIDHGRRLFHYLVLVTGSRLHGENHAKARFASHPSDPREPPGREIVVCCACPNEASAAIAAKHLKQAGFKNIRPLLGGIDAWVQAGQPLERAPLLGLTQSASNAKS